jgi:hypothetical protein
MAKTFLVATVVPPLLFVFAAHFLRGHTQANEFIQIQSEQYEDGHFRFWRCNKLSGLSLPVHLILHPEFPINQPNHHVELNHKSLVMSDSATAPQTTSTFPPTSNFNIIKETFCPTATLHGPGNY